METLAPTARCPRCEQALNKEDGAWHCPACRALYRERISCPTCHHEVETLKACGAVSYFCPHCNALQSKQLVVREYVAL